MLRTKRLTLVFTCLVLLIASLCQTASAITMSTEASEYLSNYGASLYQASRGNVRVEFTVSATKHSDCVGVSQLDIYKADGSHVATVTGSVVNGLLREDAGIHMGHYTYYGEPGVVYYMELTMYVERDGGSDTRVYTTNHCRAPS